MKDDVVVQRRLASFLIILARWESSIYELFFAVLSVHCIENNIPNTIAFQVMGFVSGRNIWCRVNEQQYMMDIAGTWLQNYFNK